MEFSIYMIKNNYIFIDFIHDNNHIMNILIQPLFNKSLLMKTKHDMT